MTENPTIDARPRSAPRVADAVAERRTVRKVRRLSRPRLVSDDGTPTLWWAIVNIIIPILLVISIVALAIVRQ
jgi:hypothetical protein